MILRPNRRFFPRATLVATALLCALATRATGEDISAVYSGKTVSFVVASAAESSLDKYARAIGRYLVKHIPGGPVIRVSNMEGGSGRKATLWLYNKAPRDGLTIAALTQDAVVGPLIGDDDDKTYEPMKLEYLGNAASAVYVCISRLDAPATDFSLMRQRRLVMGALQDGGPTLNIPLALAKLAGARFRMVPGYRDHSQLLDAIEYGEIHGACGFSWSALWARWPDLINDHKVNVFLQFALNPLPALTALKVPIVWDFVTDPRRRFALELLARTQQIGRPYAAPPHVPQQRITALRVAFERTMKDPEFKADARKAKLSLSPMMGDDMQLEMVTMYSAPGDVVEMARAARRPGEPDRASIPTGKEPLDATPPKG